jgi:hypothetical protein
VHDPSADPAVSTRYLPSPQAVHDASAICPVEIPYLPASGEESTAYSIVVLLGPMSFLMRVLMLSVIVYVSCVCVKGGGGYATVI